MTTVGVLWAVSGITPESPTIVLDVEGSDSRQREDPNLERKLATFALSLSDHVYINLWCHDIGRRHASGKDLLKITFQVYLNKFTDAQRLHRRQMTFVIRDRTRTPDAKLIGTLDQDIAEVWAQALPPWMGARRLRDYFVVSYALLDNYEEHPQAFEAQVEQLRNKFRSHRTASQRVPAKDLAVYADSIWAVIAADQHLNLPDKDLLVARLRCEELRRAALQLLRGHTLWPGNSTNTNAAFTTAILSAPNGRPSSGGSHPPSAGARPPHSRPPSQSQLLPPEAFGRNATVAILECLHHYDTEGVYYNKEAFDAHRLRLLQDIQQAVVDVYVAAVMPLTRRDLLLPARAACVAVPPDMWPVLSKQCQRHEKQVSDVARKCQQGWQVPPLMELKDGSVLTWNVMNRVRYELKDMMKSEYQFILDKMKNRFDQAFAPVSSGSSKPSRSGIRKYVREGLVDGFNVLLNLAIFQLDQSRFKSYNANCIKDLRKKLTNQVIDPDDPALKRSPPGRTPLQERLLEAGEGSLAISMHSGVVHVLDALGWERLEPAVKITTPEACQEAWENLWGYAQLRLSLALSSESVTQAERQLEQQRQAMLAEQERLREMAQRAPMDSGQMSSATQFFNGIASAFKRRTNIFGMPVGSDFERAVKCWVYTFFLLMILIVASQVIKMVAIPGPLG